MDLVLKLTHLDFKILYILMLLSCSTILVYGEEEMLYCYQCHSERDPDCEFINANSSVYYKPCVSPDPSLPPLCRKIEQKIYPRGNLRLVFRKCGWIPDTHQCYRVRNYAHAETVCQCFTDGCNQAGPLNAPSAVLSLVIAAFVQSNAML